MNPSPQTHLAVVPDADTAPGRIASSIRALAQIQDLTHAEVAEMAEMDATALSKALKLTRAIKADELESIAKALDVSVNFLYVGGDEIRKRAMRGVGIPVDTTPPDPSEQAIRSSTCMPATNVVSLWREQEAA